MPCLAKAPRAFSVPTPGLITWHNLMGHRPRRVGQHVLINGAGGGVGADHVLDYTRDDPTQGSARYDFTLDVASNLKLSDCERVLHPDGIYNLLPVRVILRCAASIHS